ncbi:Levodione reductase [Colletotrichum siamense]|uniref:Levodione reductase n=1 Tax=Colletotrichum siamense TaxID=690259 RepID=A0A9P5EQC7_COLSI|nr:Levodione reductase [Colletotrichum siamense]KAF4857680.1 Levodione reductase [Colletotrichum siamense]
MEENVPKEAAATHLPSQRLLGKVVLVTGAGGSIGLETSTRLLQEGANLGLVDISSDTLERAVSQLKVNIPGETIENRILTVTADVTSEEAVEQYTTKIASHFQRLDCAFLNAGVSYTSTSIFDTTEETYDRIMQVNVKSGMNPISLQPGDICTFLTIAAFLGIKHTAKAMKDLGTGGSIILTSSIAGLRGTPGLIVYSTSKFALRGLALTAASELGPLGIRVNTIHPSGINTPMFKASWSPEKMEELRKGMPLGRFAETDDISGVVAFLASDDSKFMTGGFLKIDGGCVSF